MTARPGVAGIYLACFVLVLKTTLPGAEAAGSKKVVRDGRCPPGYPSASGVCCSKTCPACGGKSCRSVSHGNCCVGSIKSSGHTCRDISPPCIIDPLPIAFPCIQMNVNGSVQTREIRGSWVKAPSKMRSGKEAMDQIQCRAMHPGSRKTCSTGARGTSLTPTAAGLPRTFEPNSCFLKPFTPEHFITALGSRNLYILGDGLSTQHQASLECDLKSMITSTTQTETDTIQTLVNDATITHVHVYNMDSMIEMAQRFNSEDSGMRDVDICVVNIGVHYNDMRCTPEETGPSCMDRVAFNVFLAWFEYECLLKKCLPCTIVWRETSHQHYPGTKGGLYDKEKNSTGECDQCEAVKMVEAHRQNWRNKDANKVMERNNVPILKVWAMSVVAHEMHDPVSVGVNDTEGCDCTHYCNFRAGLFEAWTTVLMNFLMAFSGGDSGFKEKGPIF